MLQQHPLPRGDYNEVLAPNTSCCCWSSPCCCLASGKISELMGDVAKGIKSFKKGMAEDDEDVAKQVPPRTIDNDVSSTNDRSKTG